MTQIQLSVAPPAAPRNRGTVAARIILAIPHIVLVQVWLYAVEVVTVIQWFVQVFTGKRHAALQEFADKWLRYATSVWAYIGLLHDDPYPGFIDVKPDCPVRYEPATGETVNRLTVGLRFLWIIPALLVGVLVIIGGVFVGFAAWCTILVTGKMPDGMWTYLHRNLRYMAQMYAYALLLTDDYPSWASTAA